MGDLRPEDIQFEKAKAAHHAAGYGWGTREQAWRELRRAKMAQLQADIKGGKHGTES